MHNLTSKLIIFNDQNNNEILNDLSNVLLEFKSTNNKEKAISGIYKQINKLLELSTKNGFNHNLWQNYLTYILVMSENPFTLICENSNSSIKSVKEFVKNDLEIFKQLFNYDFSEIEQILGINCFTIVTNYTSIDKNEHFYNKNISDKITLLSNQIDESKDIEELYETIINFYKNYGVGNIGLNKAFRLSNDDLSLIPISNINNVTLNDLVGYEDQKQRLISNTEAFINNKKANNVLLFGDAGTGKSTSIKAILNQYYPKGLRMIEIYKHQLIMLPKIISSIKTRNYKFIIFMDDLSFEDFETDFKYLKSIIEGGLELKPDNVLIYATSNRRHLIKETWTDRNDISQDDIHRSDTMQEKLSLVYRFGISIGYYQPSRSEYLEIVYEISKRYPEIQIPKEILEQEALKWEMHNSGPSGRTAQQFINYLLGSIDK